MFVCESSVGNTSTDMVIWVIVILFLLSFLTRNADEIYLNSIRLLIWNDLDDEKVYNWTKCSAEISFH